MELLLLSLIILNLKSQVLGRTLIRWKICGCKIFWWLEKRCHKKGFYNKFKYADSEGNLFDPFNGKKDLEDGCIKFIGDPDKRIKEDYLRILRYLRFFLVYSSHKHDQEIVRVLKKFNWNF